MNFLDLGILTLLLYNIFSGIKQGFVRSVFEILEIIGSLLLAVLFYKTLAHALMSFIPPLYALIFGFLIIWVVSFILIMMIGLFLHQFLTFTVLSWVNYLSGSIFGVVKAVVIMLPFVIPMIYFQFKPAEDSFFLTRFSPVLTYVLKNWAPIELFTIDFKQKQDWETLSKKFEEQKKLKIEFPKRIDSIPALNSSL